MTKMARSSSRLLRGDLNNVIHFVKWHIDIEYLSIDQDIYIQTK